MTRQPGIHLFIGAAVAGLLHALASAYWALGGTWLLETVAEFAVEAQRSGGAGVGLALGAVAAFKALGAVVPLADHLHPPPHRWVRVVSWLGVAVLFVWGGAGMVGAWIALAAADTTPSHTALMGHAFLWDPLFVVWAVLLGGALARSRPWSRRPKATTHCNTPPTRPR